MTADSDEMKSVAERVLGHEGRMIFYSKSGYRDSRPTNVAVFNSRILVAAQGRFETLWWGDFDLTLWEQRLAVLARLLERRLCLLYESDAHTVGDGDPAAVSVVTVTAAGKVNVPERRESYIVRAADGTLRFEFPPDTRKRWRWRVLAHRPRLWRFWIVETRRRRTQREHSTLVYIGARGGGRSPFLVLGLAQHRQAYSWLRTVEWTWYPADGDTRQAAKPLLDLRPRIRVGRTSLWVRLLVWPGMMYEVFAGVTRQDEP